jgi:hypothetical protein
MPGVITTVVARLLQASRTLQTQGSLSRMCLINGPLHHARTWRIANSGLAGETVGSGPKSLTGMENGSLNSRLSPSVRSRGSRRREKRNERGRQSVVRLDCTSKRRNAFRQGTS